MSSIQPTNFIENFCAGFFPDGSETVSDLPSAEGPGSIQSGN